MENKSKSGDLKRKAICMFCGKTEDEVALLVNSNRSTGICPQCAEQSYIMFKEMDGDEIDLDAVRDSV